MTNECETHRSLWTWRELVGTVLSVFIYLFIYFCIRLESMFFMMLRVKVGEHYEGSAPLVLDLLVAYEAYQGLIPSRSTLTDTDKLVVMQSL